MSNQSTWLTKFKQKPLFIFMSLLVVGVSVFGVLAAAQKKEVVQAPTKVAAVANKAERSLELLAQDIATVTLSDLHQTLMVTGTLHPLNSIEVRTSVAGRLASVQVLEGEQVQKGQIIAQIEDTDLKAKLQDKLGALEAGESQLVLTNKAYAKGQNLLKQGYISQTDFDTMESNYLVAKASIKSLKAQVVQAQKALNDAVIRAPMTGMVSQRVADAGLAVAINAPVVTLQSLDIMTLEVSVPTNEIPRIDIGQKAEFKIAGFGTEHFKGQVERINPSAEKGSHSIDVFLRVMNPTQKLRGGMLATGQLLTNSSTSALVIPVLAVHTLDEQSWVFRVNNQSLEKVFVVLGSPDSKGEQVEVKSGLAANDMIVASHMDGLEAEQKVTLHLEPNASSSHL